jgi:hypothetical protein
LQAGQAILEGDESFSLHQPQTNTGNSLTSYACTTIPAENNFIRFTQYVIEVWDKAQKPEHVIDQALALLRRVPFLEGREDLDGDFEMADSESKGIGSKRKRETTTTPVKFQKQSTRMRTRQHREKLEDELQSIVFKAALKIPDYQQAYAALAQIIDSDKYVLCQFSFLCSSFFPINS